MADGKLLALALRGAKKPIRDGIMETLTLRMQDMLRAEMQDMACELLKGRTVLMVTHDPGEAARLGHKITVMESSGLRDVTPPPGAIPRAVDAPETLRTQADLLAQLLRAA